MRYAIVGFLCRRQFHLNSRYSSRGFWHGPSLWNGLVSFSFSFLFPYRFLSVSTLSDSFFPFILRSYPHSWDNFPSTLLYFASLLILAFISTLLIISIFPCNRWCYVSKITKCCKKISLVLFPLPTCKHDTCTKSFPPELALRHPIRFLSQVFFEKSTLVLPSISISPSKRQFLFFSFYLWLE